MVGTRFKASMHLIIILPICVLFPYPPYFKTVRGTKGLGQTRRYMIWTMVVLDFPSIAVLRTGRQAVVALTKCECLVLNEVIIVCAVFSIHVVSSIHLMQTVFNFPHYSSMLISQQYWTAILRAKFCWKWPHEIRTS